MNNLVSIVICWALVVFVGLPLLWMWALRDRRRQERELERRPTLSDLRRRQLDAFLNEQVAAAPADPSAVEQPGRGRLHSAAPAPAEIEGGAA